MPVQSDQIQSPGAGAGRLVAVVVTFNRLEKLKVTLARLLESTSNELEAIVVIDNASRDGTGEWLAGLDEPRLDIVRCAENLGGAGGFETGMRHATRRYDPDWMLVMDDDARPARGALAGFHKVVLLLTQDSCCHLFFLYFIKSHQNFFHSVKRFKKMESNENDKSDNKEQPLNDEEKETVCLFDFEEEKCDATFVTKDKKLKMPSSFLCYVSEAFKEELEKNSNVISDVNYTSDTLSLALSYYRPQFYNEEKISFQEGVILL